MKGTLYTEKKFHHTLTMLCMNESYEMEYNEESQIRQALIDNNTNKVIKFLSDIDKMLVQLGGAFNYQPSLLLSILNGDFQITEQHVGYGNCDDDGTDEYV